MPMSLSSRKGQSLDQLAKLIYQTEELIANFDEVVVDRRDRSAAMGRNRKHPNLDSSYAFFSETGGMGDEGATRTLDEFCEARAVAVVHFIKIDVEGAEMKVLRGASRLLSSPGAPRVVMVEIVDDYLRRFGDNKRDAIAFMSAFGYAPFVVRGGELKATAVEAIDTENVYFQKG